MHNEENFSHSASVLKVTDIEKSIDFYTKRLPFSLTISWGNPTEYAVLKNGGVSIHLTSQSETNLKEITPSHIYIFVHDVDEIFNQCENNGVHIKSQLGYRDYKMKDFDIADLDGHIITFGNGQ